MTYSPPPSSASCLPFGHHAYGKWRVQSLGGNLQFTPATLDVQMSTTNSALIAVITGNMKVNSTVSIGQLVRVRLYYGNTQ